MNSLKLVVLLSLLTGLLVTAGRAFGGNNGMLIMFVISMGINFFSYWYSDKIVLKMYGAREVDIHSAPELVGMVANLARRAGMPMPRVYIIDTDAPNAFATGRDPEHAAVAVTASLMRALTPQELEGVMAHELAHVKHRDILTSTIAATLAGAISALANFALFFGGRSQDGRPANPLVGIVVALIAPLAAALIQMAISRAREFEADRGGAEICGNPDALADALTKIDAYARGIPMPTAEANPATAQMMILNPLSGGGIAGLFSTHPATEERVDRLRRMAGTGRYY